MNIREQLAIPRQQPRELDPEDRLDNFDEVSKGFDEPTALVEAQRCLKCWINTVLEGNAQDGSECILCGGCVDVCPESCFQLIPLVDEKQGGQLLNRVRSLRRHLSAEMGFLVPPVHISDNLRLKPREYLFSLRGMEIGRWQTEGAQLLAVSGEPGRRPLTGKETREPAFGVPAIWIAPALEDQAIAAGLVSHDGAKAR